MDITPDGKIAVSGGKESGVRVWNILSGEELLTINKNSDSGSPNLLKITPDGRKVIIAYWEYLGIWDIGSGKLLRRLHKGNVDSLGISPDGKFAVAGLRDMTVRLWNIETGKCIAVYQAKYSIEVEELMCDGLIVCLSNNRIIFLASYNLPLGVPVVTAFRSWLYKKSGKGEWNRRIRANCKWCGQSFMAPKDVLHTINAIEGNARLSVSQSPCMKLEVDAWNNHQLYSYCPFCKGALKFNPFIGA